MGFVRQGPGHEPSTSTEAWMIIVAIGLGALALAMLQEAVLARRNRGSRTQVPMDRNLR